MLEQNQPLVISKLSDNLDELQERYQKFGYLYFKKAIFSETCQSLLDEIIEQCAPYIGKNDSGKPVLKHDDGFGGAS